MPFKLSWYQPKRIVLMEVEGVLTSAEVRDLIAQAGDYVSTGTPLVHFLVDTRTLQRVENVGESLKIVQGNPPHPSMGWMMVIGTMNPLVRFFLDFVGLITKSRYRRFDDLLPALDFLKDVDHSLVAFS